MLWNVNCKQSGAHALGTKAHVIIVLGELRSQQQLQATQDHEASKQAVVGQDHTTALFSGLLPGTFSLLTERDVHLSIENINNFLQVQ